MNELKSQVNNLLRNYRTDIRKVALLRYELANLSPVTPAEVLEAMAFSKGEGGIRPPVGHISDRTYQIAMNYSEEAERLDHDSVSELSAQIDQLERKLHRLEYCVSQLSESEAAVIRGLYFEGKAQKELMDELHMCESTLKRCRNRGVENLAEMYLALRKAGVKLEW